LSPPSVVVETAAPDNKKVVASKEVVASEDMNFPPQKIGQLDRFP
jgi:hypothetical protein